MPNLDQIYSVDLKTRDFGQTVRKPFPGELVPSDKVLVAGNNSRTDDSKVKGYYLIPPLPLAELARVYKIGADKYEPRGWEKGMPFSEVIDGLYRHLDKWRAGETHDTEDGQHHMASVAWRAFAIMEYERTHPEMDDVHA